MKPGQKNEESNEAKVENKKVNDIEEYWGDDRKLKDLDPSIFFSDEFFRKAQEGATDWIQIPIDRSLYKENLWFTFIRVAGLLLIAALLSWIFGADQGIVYGVVILPLVAVLKTAYLDFEPLFIQAAYSQNSIIVRRGTAAESIERFDLRTIENIELKLTPIGKLRNSGSLNIFGYGGQIQIPYVRDPLDVQAKLMEFIRAHKQDAG